MSAMFHRQGETLSSQQTKHELQHGSTESRPTTRNVKCSMARQSLALSSLCAWHFTETDQYEADACDQDRAPDSAQDRQRRLHVDVRSAGIWRECLRCRHAQRTR